MSRDLKIILEQLLKQPAESEILEFKARKTLDKDLMGHYFSALSNEANLSMKKSSWLLFGVTDDRKIVNSNYLDTRDSVNELKRYISEHTTDHTSFIDVHEIYLGSDRVLMFEIPATKQGTPMSFKGIAYERQGESLLPLSDEKRLRIMNQTRPDWSSQVVHAASIKDLDPRALSKAREYYKRNRPTKVEECDSWDDITFLNKIHITKDGKITYAALILLGNDESFRFISDSVLRIRWILRDEDHHTLDNEMFGLPFILSIDDACSKIRNLRYEYFRPNTLFPDRMETYELSMLREALNNCVAHQDYMMREYITLVEYDRDRLVFSNAGSFIPGSIEAVIRRNAPAPFYRNPFLAEAMAELGMVDVAGGGIIKMFESQKSRFFPMPEYTLGTDHVEVTITGKVIDAGFADILMNNPHLRLRDVILLDSVQKRKNISDEDVKYLRKKGFVDGRKPNLIVSSTIIKKTNDVSLKGKSITDRGFNDKYYTDLILKLIDDYGSTTRSEINAMLTGKLPDILADDQKYNKISYLLKKMIKEGTIINNGPNRTAPNYERRREIDRTDDMHRTY